MEITSIDFLHLDQFSGGYECLLVATDHFTRYTQTSPTRNKASRKVAAERLFSDFILRIGMPKHILHNQGKEFDNKLFYH